MDPSSAGAGGNSLPSVGADGRKRGVCYFYDPEMGNYYFGYRHPMKPLRVRMAHELAEKYRLLSKMEVLGPCPAGGADLRGFHADDYIDLLRTVTPETQKEYASALKQFNVGGRGDCPVFDGLYDFCKSYTGASIHAAAMLNNGHDIAINWSGGMHHAKKCSAAGFCYVNDVVLAILELLKHHERVLYVDIDVHHGDGVEEAFYTTDRVMTVSFHMFGQYFPGTGHIDDIGVSKGKYYSLNIPLDAGIDDESYQSMFKPIMSKVMEVFRPGAVVLQCGADSLSGDRLGCFNLSVRGHGECVKYMRSFNVPLLLLGGGGYTLRNVASCWCYETGIALGQELENNIPMHEYYMYFGPDYTLHSSPSNKENKNTSQKLDNIRSKVLDNLSKLQHAPSVQFQKRAPDSELPELDEHQEDPDERHGLDSYIELAGHKPLEASRRTVVIRNKRDFAETETNNQDRKGSGVYGSFSYAPKIFVSKLQQVPSVQFQKRAPDSELPELDEHQEDPDERHGLDSYNEWGGHKPLEASRSTVVIRNKRDFAETETNNQDGKGVTTEHTGPAPTMAEEIGSPGPPTPSKLLQQMRISKRDGDRPAKDR